MSLTPFFPKMPHDRPSRSPDPAPPHPPRTALAAVRAAPAFADDGGPTQTIALLTGSAAIGGGSPIACPTTDQRGVTRHVACDIGAVEFLPEPGSGAALAGGVVLLVGLRGRARCPRAC